MQSSSSSILTREEQEKLLTPHEYIGGYRDCIFCRHRTKFTCIKCGYCYSCHWKKEQIEEDELRDHLKDFYTSLSKEHDDNNDQKLRPPHAGKKEMQGMENGEHKMCLGRKLN